MIEVLIGVECIKDSGVLHYKLRVARERKEQRKVARTKSEGARVVGLSAGFLLLFHPSAHIHAERADYTKKVAFNCLAN